jgi:hypothetical protein
MHVMIKYYENFNHAYLIVNLPSNLVGLLDDSQFNVTTIEANPISVLPDIIQVEASILGTNLNIKLYKMTGLWQASSMNTKVYIFDDYDSSVQQTNSENLVRFISSY